MKPLLRDMVRVGVSVAAVTTLVLLPAYLLRPMDNCWSRATSEPSSDRLSIVSLDEGWNSMGIAINDRGDVVGTAIKGENAIRAFVIRSKKAQLLPLPKGAPLSVAMDINDEGTVVGNAGGQEKVRGVFWRGEQINILTSGRRDTIAATISKDGTVAGLAVDPRSGDRASSFLYSDATRKWSVVRTSPYANRSFLQSGIGIEPLLFEMMQLTARVMNSNGFSGMLWKRSGDGKAIGEFIPQAGNAAGSLVGIAFQKDAPVPAIFKAGKIATLPTPEGAEIAIPLSMNSSEIAVGAAASGSKLRPAGWSNGKTGFLPVPGGRQGLALGINDQKAVVGVIEAEDGTAHAALWQDGKVIDLNKATDDKSGWTLVQARDINNKGQIVGTAMKGDRFATFVMGCPKR